MPRTRRRPALSDGRMIVYAGLVSVVASIVAEFVVRVRADDSAASFVVVVLITWIGFAAAHALLVWRTYSGRTGAALAEALSRVERGRFGRWTRNRLVRWMLGISEVASFGTQLAVMAVAGVLTLALVPGLRTSLNLGLGVVLVVVSWLDMAMAFAVSYARIDHSEGGLVFADDGEREFSDYLYVAFAAQATFGTTDVTIASARLRRIVTIQSLLAFVFNTVAVAMLVSLMVGSG